MADAVRENPPTALSTEVIKASTGKEFGGQPFFEVDLKPLIKQEIVSDPDVLDKSDEGIEKATQHQLEVGGYDKVTVPSYNYNNNVYLLIEPDTQNPNRYRAYMTAFPSEEQFQQLRAKNEELRQFNSVSEYRDHIVSLFALPTGERFNPKNSDEYEHNGSLFVPLSQHWTDQSGRVQTPLSAIMDRLIAERISSNQK